MEGEARWREAVGKTMPFLCVEMFEINFPLLPSILLFSLFFPHPLLLPLLLFLLHPLPLFLLSLFPRIPLLHLLVSLCTNKSHNSSICAAVFFSHMVIAISDMITAAIIAVTTVNIITADSALINTTAGFAINHRVTESTLLLKVILRSSVIILTFATYIITIS